MKKCYKFSGMLLLLLTWVFALQVSAQEFKVSGKVTDATDGSTLPGVSILIKGTTRGTATDINGNFALDARIGNTLVFSFIGYKTQDVEIKDAKKLNIVMYPTVTALQEVLVIGYGVVKKKDATGSVAAVDFKKFNPGAIASPTELVSGKVAGVQIVNDGGAPGSNATVRIRVGSSLSATNDPLYVIDGIPVEGGNVDGMRNSMSMINPSDIETFTVLKDASATAIYGARASNGVILITTKKGKLGTQGKGGLPFNLEYNASISLSNRSKKLDVLNGDEYRALMHQKYPDSVPSNLSKLALLGTANTDWQDQIFKTAYGTDHYLTATGSYKTMPYRASFGYSNQDGILKTDNMNRTTVSGSVNPAFFKDHLKVTANATGSFVNNRFADRGSIGAATHFDPTKPVYNDSVYVIPYTHTGGLADTMRTMYGGYYAWVQANGRPVALATTNPLALLELKQDLSSVNRFIGNASLDYKFHFLPELRANLNLGYDHQKSDGTVDIPDYATYSFNLLKGGGTKTHYTDEIKNNLLEFYLNYGKDLNAIKSRVDVMGGYSWQHIWHEKFSITTNQATNDTTYQPTTRPTEYYMVSFYGRLNYTFMNRYLLTFTVRDDGTSRFAPSQRWGLFPSGAFAWKVIEEPFMKNSQIFSDLKLRAGYGVTGQQDINQGNYPYLNRYTLGLGTAAYQMGSAFYTTLRPEGYDAKIKWEEQATTNVGLDFGLLKDKISGSIEYYYKKTTDLINKIPVPAGSNLTNEILTNIGDMENKGFEFTLTGRPVTKSDLYWEVNFNTTYNENKITKLTAVDDPAYQGVEIGTFSGGVGNTIQVHSVGYPAYSFFVYEQKYDENGKPKDGAADIDRYVDRNGDGKITGADRYHFHSPLAKWSFGISSNLNYKNWDFSFSGRANLGNYVYNNFQSEVANYQMLYHAEGPYLSNIASSVSETGFFYPHYLSDYYIQKASFFRMDNMSLSYSFKNLTQAHLKLRLSFTVNNAFVITSYKGIDPEVYGGIDNNVYPRPRTFMLGANVQF